MATERPVIDASGYTRYPPATGHPLFWGILGMVAIETAVFSALIITYLYLALGDSPWPPPPMHPPELLLPTINTVILLLSSVVIHRADRHIREGEQRKLALGLSLGIAMALIFLALKAYEYGWHVSYRWTDHAYASIVWTIVGFHTAHVFALLLKTLVMATLAWKGYFHQERRLAITVNGIYWHFVVAVWVPLYVLLYWAPRFL